MAQCRVYWGSHGCGLERGHPDQRRHVCQDEDDGPCSEIRWVQDGWTGLWIWEQRFADLEEEFTGTAYPAWAFGEDLPRDQLVPDETVEAVSEVRKANDALPVMRDGKWVRASDGRTWGD
jgi:hypothetical protein